jgi:PadR family transcriptional regulator AphA
VSDPVHLTTTSFVVLGLVACLEPATSYDLKRHVATSIGYFWPFPHSQLYAEPARLTAAGLLAEEVETSGRKRRRYSVTAAGRAALTAWLAEPSADPTEIRDLGLLKLFFAAEADAASRHALAAAQHRAHEARWQEYDALRERIGDLADRYQLATLDMGLRFERAAAAFWAELVDDGRERPPTDPTDERPPWHAVPPPPP